MDQFVSIYDDRFTLKLFNFYCELYSLYNVGINRVNIMDFVGETRFTTIDFQLVDGFNEIFLHGTMATLNEYGYIDIEKIYYCEILNKQVYVFNISEATIIIKKEKK